MEWEQCWLNYHKVDYKTSPAFQHIYHNSDDCRVLSAVQELKTGLSAMLDITPFSSNQQPERTQQSIQLVILTDQLDRYGLEGYEIALDGNNIKILAATGAGILYGSFSLLRGIAASVPLEQLCGIDQPSAPLRMLNHWDNLDGSIERGYAGNSFFFQDSNVLVNSRTRDYARLVSSIGIDAVVINNVNVVNDAISLVTPRYYDSLKKLSTTFEAYGIKLFLSLDFSAPIDLNALETADPFDEKVQSWWNRKMQEIFSAVPNLGGFLIKADSEGRPGPFSYGRTHADGANMLARAVAPFGGSIIWRCFVYDCQQDWRDKSSDRAKSGYDNFMPLDGQFLDNVALQIKNGPMDFQVREPVSPLLGAMQQTNQILEVQITQEYTGQQKHVCYLVPMWREILQFHTYCQANNDRVEDVISGKTYGNQLCGMAAVANTGNEPNWTGSDLAAANLYGYGRLSWNANLSSEQIASEWIQLTFSANPSVVRAISDILISSWPAYEKYTSPLGIGWMVNPGHHFGPNVDGYEYDRWGTYHRADFEAIGVDRTSGGTGYTRQYFSPNFETYDDVDTCPEELLLFFHRVNYHYILKSGKTLLQHIYDTHFEGVDDVRRMISQWNSIHGLIDETVFQRTLERLNFQLEHAMLWRDEINTYFYRKTGIRDKHGRTIVS